MTFDLLSFRSSSGHKKESNPGNECAILELVPFKKIRNSSIKTAKKKVIEKKETFFAQSGSNWNTRSKLVSLQRARHVSQAAFPLRSRRMEIWACVSLSKRIKAHRQGCIFSFLFFKPTQATPVKKIYKETISPSSSFQSWVAGSFNFGIIDGACRAHWIESFTYGTYP